MTRIFLDMDGVLADYEKLRLHYKVTGDELKRMNNAFKEMEPMPGAIAGVNSLIGMGYEVWVASKPATGLPHTYADKATWILQHLPQLKRRIILTHDKGLLGCRDDYLVDDRPHKANCVEFPGRLVVFGKGPCASYRPRAENWAQLLGFFRHWNQRGLTIGADGTTSDLVPLECSRPKDHDGPCNGWPCAPVREKLNAAGGYYR